jgi:lactal_redase: lactaldehyde reductase
VLNGLKAGCMNAKKHTIRIFLKSRFLKNLY